MVILIERFVDVHFDEKFRKKLATPAGNKITLIKHLRYIKV